MNAKRDKSLSEKKKGSIPRRIFDKKKSFKGYGRIFEKKNAGLCVCLYCQMCPNSLKKPPTVYKKKNKNICKKKKIEEKKKKKK